jgi:putative hydrolase of the HAD superfamily
VIASRSGRCVVFDLDDTLYDELDFVRSGFAAVSAVIVDHFGFDARALLEGRLASRLLEGAFQSVQDALGLPPRAMDLMLATYRFHVPTLEMPRELHDALMALRERDGAVACITDGRSITQRHKLQALGLAGLLAPVLISEETGHGKPDAHNFREVMRRVEAREYWYIADNPAKDFVAPNALGWITVSVDRGKRIHDLPARAFPLDHLAQRQADLLNLVRELAVMPVS